MRWLAYGERAVLFELAGIEEVLALDHAIRAARLTHVDDVVPGERTLLVTAATAERLAGVVEAIQRLRPGRTAGHSASDSIEIGVTYDGPDLAEVGALVGLSSEEVVAAHTGTPWTVGFGGFAPGFAYLVNGDPRLHVPRRAEPRAAVPAGSVGLAGPYSGIYPRSSPGGWQLIGRTTVTLFDATAVPPALLRPGMTVTFREVGT